MGRTYKFLGYCVCVFVILLAGFSSAFSGVDMLRGLDPVMFYEMNYMWVDFFIAFLIFYGIAKFTFAEKFKGSENFIIGGISLALSFAMVLWMRKYETGLLFLGPFALLILLAAVSWLLFRMFEGIGKIRAVCLVYIALYLAKEFLGLNEIIKKYAYEAIGYIDALFYIFIIVLIISLFFHKKERVTTIKQS